TRAGGVQHAEADESAVQRLMAGAAAGDDPDLATPRSVTSGDDLVLVVDVQVRVCRLDAEQGVSDDVFRIVDELLHWWFLSSSIWSVSGVDGLLGCGLGVGEGDAARR